jgi:hypothetical protein
MLAHTINSHLVPTAHNSGLAKAYDLYITAPCRVVLLSPRCVGTCLEAILYLMLQWLMSFKLLQAYLLLFYETYFN